MTFPGYLITNASFSHCRLNNKHALSLSINSAFQDSYALLIKLKAGLPDLVVAGVSLLGEGVGRTKLLNGELSEPLAHVNGLLDGLALDDTGSEATSKGITGTVGIVDFGGINGVDGVLLDLILALDGNDGRLGALGDDGNALALGVLLGEVGKSLGDLLDIGGVEAVGLGVGSGLALVADHIVPVGGRGIKGLLEELADEGGGEGKDEGLVAAGSLLGELHDGGRADGEVVATDIVDLSVLDERPDLGLLQVLKIVVVGGTELSAHGAVVAGNDNTATAGVDLRVDTVLNAETSLLDSIVEDGGVLVVTNTTEIDDAVGREEVLSTAGGILGSTTSNQLSIVVLEEVLEEALVLLLSEDGVVGLKAVLLEESLVTEGLDVEKGVLEAKKSVVLGGGHLVERVATNAEATWCCCVERVVDWDNIRS